MPGVVASGLVSGEPPPNEVVNGLVGVGGLTGGVGWIPSGVSGIGASMGSEVGNVGVPNPDVPASVVVVVVGLAVGRIGAIGPAPVPVGLGDAGLPVPVVGGNDAPVTGAGVGAGAVVISGPVSTPSSSPSSPSP